MNFDLNAVNYWGDSELVAEWGDGELVAVWGIASWWRIGGWKQHKFKWKAGVVNEVFLFAIYWSRVSCPMLNPLSALVRPLEKF